MKVATISPLQRNKTLSPAVYAINTTTADYGPRQESYSRQNVDLDPHAQSGSRSQYRVNETAENTGRIPADGNAAHIDKMVLGKGFATEISVAQSESQPCGEGDSQQQNVYAPLDGNGQSPCSAATFTVDQASGEISENLETKRKQHESCGSLEDISENMTCLKAPATWASDPDCCEEYSEGVSTKQTTLQQRNPQLSKMLGDPVEGNAVAQEDQTAGRSLVEETREVLEAVGCHDEGDSMDGLKILAAVSLAGLVDDCGPEGLEHLSREGFYRCGCQAGQCPFSCLQQSQLEKHLLQSHIHEPDFPCVHCGSRERCVDGLLYHLDQHVDGQRHSLYCRYHPFQQSTAHRCNQPCRLHHHHRHSHCCHFLL
jgi:hypothetical protein